MNSTLISSRPGDESEYDAQIMDILARFDGHSWWQPLKEALEHRQEVVPWLAPSQIEGVTKICFQEGLASHNRNDDALDRQFHSYLQSVIHPLITRGEISDGSAGDAYDDRKLRWSDVDLATVIDHQTKTLTLSVGPTWYQQCQVDIQREPTESLKLMSLGIRDHSDPYAYFARGLGISIVPLTIDGHAFLGRRVETKEYKDCLCFVAGWLDFSDMVNAKNIYDDIERELREEILLSSPINLESLRFAGLSGHPLTGEVDLVYVMQTELSDDYFEETHWPEHTSWLAIRSREEAEQLLTCGTIGSLATTYNLTFSCRYSLEYLIHNHWQS